ncbi:guanylate kinase [Candidatus Uhrbacteria bacterium CG10_big_fil_rev_8_21_14_0_10_48_16]|uniref:Guanylate kinase n=1 Tax=Candidatus Uhrbacteria bacterium CG10_big_fil_rev_8_21_14_0_10_48_16 TaxID=1975038 RepID=A0A2M8LHK9_9BACT|nr:MAG: guanylate kinase [Candidatus Uhrbacteria bacterium CG10_big_fil_rev_8_21_14_0_10_48_16]
MNKTLYIITGPSGVGKSTVAQELLKRRPTLKKVVTCTTRKMREGETDGVSYHFLDRKTFQSLIAEKALFEWDEHYDNFYGIRNADVTQLMEEGSDVLFVVDIAGAKTIKESHPEAVLFFIEPETTDQLLQRIEKRDQGTTTGLEERKASIHREMAFAELADHRVMNKEGKLDETVENIHKIMGSLDETR